MKLLIFLTIIVLIVAELEIGDHEPLRTREELEKSTFEDLEACIWRRGQTCKFCVGMYDSGDRHHMVNTCMDIQHLPVSVLVKPPTKYREIKRTPPPGSVPSEIKKADPQYEAMMYRMRYEESEKARKKQDAIDNLKKQGFDVSNLKKEEGEFASMERKIKEATRKKYDEERKAKEEALKKIKKEEL
jgi:hypothetical protein